MAPLSRTLACLAALAGPASAQSVVPGCEEPTRPGAIASASPTGTFTLASGEQIRLADIRLLGETGLGARNFQALVAWLRSLTAEPVLVALGAPDRWDTSRGRLVLRAPAASLQPGLDVAELLVGEGVAVVDPGEADALCRPALLGLEAQARRNRLGVWAGADAPVVQAAETAALAARLGRFTLVEGVVVSVGERATRTYLNFGGFGSGAFTLTIPRRSWTALRRRGVTAETLRGRRVRARGTIEMWRAPVMEIVAPDALEVIETVAEPRR